jgi:isochorismate synthase
MENSILIQTFISEALNKNLCFAIWRDPDMQNIQAIVQKNISCIEYKNISQAGFVLHPFSKTEKHKAYLITPDQYYNFNDIDNHDLAEFQNLKGHKRTTDHSIKINNSKEQYLSEINQMLSELRKGRINKVIQSRIHSIEGKSTEHLASSFIELCKAYKHSFNFIVNIPNKECWMGASPEPLLKIDNNKLFTASIAATRKHESKPENLRWSKKEIEEQKIVSEYIKKTLKDFNLKYTISPTENYIAGNIVHLRNRFHLNITDQNIINSLVERLHPTPAVCGLPKKEAFELINMIEQHDRSYYSGFLGPININEKTGLYVNIRSMKILNGHLHLYVGGGITKDSDPESEWLETEIKSRTLLNIIERIG